MAIDGVACPGASLHRELPGGSDDLDIGCPGGAQGPEGKQDVREQQAVADAAFAAWKIN